MTVLNTKVPYLKLKGTPEEIGFQHGSQLKERVRSCYDFYINKLLVNPKIDLEMYGNLFLEKVREFHEPYALEIEAIARGAELEPWQVSILNARTEVFLKTMDHIIGECTTCYFRDKRIFGENWDWMIETEDLIVLLEVEREDGHRFLMLAEPGIIGKIGFNSAGLGVGLNILHGNQFDVGVPVHVMLRAALDSQSIAAVQKRLEETSFCTFSNILLADDRGNYLDLELLGHDIRSVDYGQGNPIHTNHYLGTTLDETDNPMYENSVTRMRRAHELLADIKQEGVAEMQQLLLDTENGSDAICSEFERRFHYRVGTVSSMVVDLPGRCMWVTKGSPLRHEFQEFRLA